MDKLPVELLYLIGEELPHDAFLSCSLVRRDWRESALPGIFHTVKIRYPGEKDFQAFRQFISHPDHARLAAYIQAVDIEGRKPDAESDSFLKVNLADVHALVSQFPRLKKVVFRHLVLAVDAEAVARCSPISLEVLQVDGVGYARGFADLAATLHLFRPCDTTYIGQTPDESYPGCTTQRWDSDPDAVAPAPHLELAAAALQTTTEEHYALFRRTIASCRQLVVDLDDNGCSSALCAFLGQIAPGLQDLFIIGGIRLAPASPADLLDALSSTLAACTSLRTLSVSAGVPALGSDTAASWAPLLEPLRHVPRTTQFVGFAFDFAYVEPDLAQVAQNLEQLRAVLARFERLEHLLVGFMHDWGVSTDAAAAEEAVTACVRRVLRVFDERSVLRVVPGKSILPTVIQLCVEAEY